MIEGVRQSRTVIHDTQPTRLPWQRASLHLPFADTVSIPPALFVLHPEERDVMGRTNEVGLWGSGIPKQTPTWLAHKTLSVS